jgi:hypothetical protein
MVVLHVRLGPLLHIACRTNHSTEHLDTMRNFLDPLRSLLSIQPNPIYTSFFAGFSTTAQISQSSLALGGKRINTP